MKQIIKRIAQISFWSGIILILYGIKECPILLGFFLIIGAIVLVALAEDKKQETWQERYNRRHKIK